MISVVVREYARLTTEKVTATLDQAQLTESAFDWLCSLASAHKSSGATLLQVESRRWLRLDNYVGVLESPCGTVIEILPKHCEDSTADTATAARSLLIKMLTTALDLPVRSTDFTSLHVFKHPLLEWVMKQFVISLDLLIKKGLRFDYRRIEEQQSYLRGQLDIIKQLRQPPGRDHVFNIRHDLYLPDRAENRLLHSALLRVCRMTQQPETWRLSHELVSLLSEIPESRDIKADFKHWQSDRLMSHYQGVRPWCELVLGQYMPMAIRGRTKGISLLFPMEQLFERHVEMHLRNHLSRPYSLKAQAASEYLCDQAGSRIFQLRPDLLILKNACPYAVLDTKWKLLSSEDRSNKYGLSQADFYQLFAYGNKYLGGEGPMALIYPRTSKFQQPIPAFDFGNNLILQVLPFDIDAGQLIGFETLFTDSNENIIAA